MVVRGWAAQQEWSNRRRSGQLGRFRPHMPPHMTLHVRGGSLLPVQGWFKAHLNHPEHVAGVAHVGVEDRVCQIVPLLQEGLLRAVLHQPAAAQAKDQPPQSFYLVREAPAWWLLWARQQTS